MKYNTGNRMLPGAKLRTQARVFEMTEQHSASRIRPQKISWGDVSRKGLSFEKLKTMGILL
jgi:hypothetical protein